MGRRISGLVLVLLMLAGGMSALQRSRLRGTGTGCWRRRRRIGWCGRTAWWRTACGVRGDGPMVMRVLRMWRCGAGRAGRRWCGCVGRRGRVRYYGERFTASSFTDESLLTANDVTAGEDPVVRAAAIEALGNMNGTVLAIDPSDGRILAMVNQKLALSAGAEPCSTIKVAVALAALKEGIVKADTPVNLGGHYSVDLTHALARSINLYFEVLGRTMGFERVKHYANEFGLGELAGYNIPGEHLGVYPDTVLPAADGGVGRMCSFGESICMTPLQLGALVTCDCEWRDAVLSAASDDAGGGGELSAAGEAHAGYQGRDSADSAGHAGRGGLLEWDGAVAADELRAVSGVWEDGDVLG